MKLVLALAAVAVSLAAVAAGCGGDDEPSASATDEWAEGLCTAITTWKEESTDALRNVSSLSRDELEQAAEDIRSATSDFEDDLRALGAPETESGEEAEQAIDDFAATLETERADIETAIEGISGITDLPGAGQDVTASLSSMNASLSAMLAAIRTGDASDELEAALEDADACDDVG